MFYNSYEQCMAFSKTGSIHTLPVPYGSSMLCKIALKALLKLKPGTIFIDQEVKPRRGFLLCSKAAAVHEVCKTAATGPLLQCRNGTCGKILITHHGNIH